MKPKLKEHHFLSLNYIMKKKKKYIKLCYINIILSFFRIKFLYIFFSLEVSVILCPLN